MRACEVYIMCAVASLSLTVVLCSHFYLTLAELAVGSKVSIIILSEDK